MNEIFNYLIETGYSQVELISDPEKKAIVCAELAKAIAQSGYLNVATQEETQEEIQEPKKEKKAKKKTSKDALKPEASKETTEIVEEVIEQPTEVQEEVQEEVQVCDEWTEEMIALKQEMLTTLESYCDAWGDEYVYNDCLSAFTEGAFVGADSIRPTNIDGFIVYLGELAKQFAEQQ